MQMTGTDDYILTSLLILLKQYENYYGIQSHSLQLLGYAGLKASVIQ